MYVVRPDDDDGTVVMMTRGHNGWLVVSGIYELCSLTHTVEPFPLSLSFYIWGMDGNDDDTVLMTIVA